MFHGILPGVVLCQNPVQLGRAVDEGTQVYVDQSQVGSCVGFFTVCQQIVYDSQLSMSSLHTEYLLNCCK